MRKWIIPILMVLMIPLAYGIQDCKPVMIPSERDIPCHVISSWQLPNSCNTYTIKIYYSNDTPNLLDTRTMADYGNSGRCNITFNYTTSGSYVLNWSTGDLAKIIVEGEDNMASLSIMIFVMAITLAFIFTGLKFDFSKNPLANLIIKRCFILIGMFLVSLDTAMAVTIADNAGLGVNREIFRYLWIVNWSIYVFMAYLVYTTIINSVKLMNNISHDKRMGNEEYD